MLGIAQIFLQVLHSPQNTFDNITESCNNPFVVIEAQIQPSCHCPTDLSLVTTLQSLPATWQTPIRVTCLAPSLFRTCLLSQILKFLPNFNLSATLEALRSSETLLLRLLRLRRLPHAPHRLDLLKFLSAKVPRQSLQAIPPELSIT